VGEISPSSFKLSSARIKGPDSRSPQPQHYIATTSVTESNDCGDSFEEDMAATGIETIRMIDKVEAGKRYVFRFVG
jgi:hypothetical protein